LCATPARCREPGPPACIYLDTHMLWGVY
jgi:hypothetical protein